MQVMKSWARSPSQGAEFIVYSYFIFFALQLRCLQLQARLGSRFSTLWVGRHKLQLGRPRAEIAFSLRGHVSRHNVDTCHVSYKFTLQNRSEMAFVVYEIVPNNTADVCSGASGLQTGV